MQSGRKHLLPLSLFLNLVLGTVLIWRGHESAATRQPPAAVVPVAQPQQVKNTAATPVAMKQPSFHWHQLESPHFATFVQNLRSIGCPEMTIHDIVKGELDEIYEYKRQATITQNPQSLTSALELQLKTERERLLANLTAPRTTPATALSDTPAVVATAATNAGSPPASAATKRPSSSVPFIPAAFVYGSAPGAAVSQQQGQLMVSTPAAQSDLPPAAHTALDGLRASFVEALGDTVQKPDSPEYLSRWNQARSESDERFALLFGGEAFVRAQIEAVQAAAAAR